MRFVAKLYRQVLGFPVGTTCAPLVADLFLFCYEMDFMVSLSDDKQVDKFGTFNTTSRYVDDILNINNIYFDNIPSRSSDTKSRVWTCMCSTLMMLKSYAAFHQCVHCLLRQKQSSGKEFQFH